MSSPVVHAIAAVSCLGICLAVWAIQAHSLGPRDTPGVSGGGSADLPSRGQALLARLATEVEPVLAESRRVLLGQRPDGDPTCITQKLVDNRILLQGSPQGGAGLRIVAFHTGAPDAPLALCAWSQEELRPFLQAERRANALALARAKELSITARELASEVRVAPIRSVPDAAGAAVTSPAWPAECLCQLRRAVAVGDASLVRTWADEMNAGAFALTDLHRWLNALLDSHLASLDFQADCRAAFTFADSVGTETQAAQESCLPAAGLLVAWGENYLEVEHQAESLFAPPDAAVAAVTAQDAAGPPSARWMPPEVRQVFRWLRSRLSPPAQTVLDQAAAAPLDRSYLANMLFRALSARSLDQMALAVERYEKCHPTVTQAELMDVLFYRSGFYSSGYQWADRYDKRILDAAGGITGDHEAVARQAHQLTTGMLKGWENYAADIMTLTQSLDVGKLDCVRGTDMIGALYRDAGHGEYAVVRLRCGTVGHSVGAVPVDRDGKRQWLILDCLSRNPPGETWPTAYFKDLAWPQSYPGKRGPLFSAELYVRGLDGYMFAEGYVVQGEHAGQLVTAAVPYLPGSEKAGSSRVFNGPYPVLPTASLAPGSPEAKCNTLLHP
jgi:hypothetical protein